MQLNVSWFGQSYYLNYNDDSLNDKFVKLIINQDDNKNDLFDLP